MTVTLYNHSSLFTLSLDQGMEWSLLQSLFVAWLISLFITFHFGCMYLIKIRTILLTTTREKGLKQNVIWHINSLDITGIFNLRNLLVTNTFLQTRSNVIWSIKLLIFSYDNTEEHNVNIKYQNPRLHWTDWIDKSIDFLLPTKIIEF